MNKTFSSLVGASALAGITLLAGSEFSKVNAFSITQIDTSGGNPSGLPIYEISGLTGGEEVLINFPSVGDIFDFSGTLDVGNVNANGAEFKVSLVNHSTPTGGNETGPRITGLGLSVDPFTAGNLNVNSSGGTILDDTSEKAQEGVPPGAFKQLVDIVAFSSGKGVQNDGILPLSDDSISFSLSGDYSGGLALDAFGLQVQGGPDGNSYQVPGKPVPEPFTVLGTVVALGFGAYGKRELSKQKSEQ